MSWLGSNEIRLNECEIKRTDTCLGSAECMPSLGGLSLRFSFKDVGHVSVKCLAFFFLSKWFIKIFTHAALSLGENEKTRMHNQ